MRARWRLGVLVVQLAVLLFGSYLAVGKAIPSEVWFASGLLAVVVNPLLLEPYYPRPFDVIGNCVLGIVLYVLAPRMVAEPGWDVLLGFLIVAGALAAIGLIFGAGRDSPSGIARSARTLSSFATAKAIFSTIFWLSLLERFSPKSSDFWTLGITWAILIFIGSVNWQSVWSSVVRAPQPGRVEGLIGPTRLLVSAVVLPQPGTAVRIEAGSVGAEGIVLTRIKRARDTWGEIHVARLADAESLLQAGAVTISEAPAQEPAVIGSVGARSTDRTLTFNGAGRAAPATGEPRPGGVLAPLVSGW